MNPSTLTDAEIVANTDVVRLDLVPEVPVRLLSLESDWSQIDRGPFEDEVFPYWLFAWGAGQAMARYLLDNPQSVSGKVICDIGTGCGLAAIAAAKSGAARVIATDVDPNALSSCTQNARLNDVSVTCVNTSGIPSEHIDLVLASDLFFHWPENVSLLDARTTPCDALVAAPDRRAYPLDEPIHASLLNCLKKYDTRTVPSIERADIRTVSVYSRPGRAPEGESQHDANDHGRMQ